MTLEGTPINPISDNLNQASSPAAGGSYGLDGILSDTWGKGSLQLGSSDAMLSQPVAQLFEMPGYFAVDSSEFSRKLDKGFTSQDVVSVLKDQLETDEATDLKHSVRNIKVVYVDRSDNSHQSNADFKINAQGELIVPENKNILNKKDLVIEVERAEGHVGLPDTVQQESLITLVKSLSENVLDKSRGKLDDPQGLLPEAVKDALNIQLPTEFLQPMQQAMQNMQRFAGGGHGQISAGEADSYFPQRDVERLHNEDNNQASLKDAIAGFATRGESEPYYAMRDFGDRGLGVGRYMFTADLLLEWLEDLFSGCGKPPDAAKVLAKLLKTMKNKELAGKCAQVLAKAAQSGELKSFLHDLKSGKLKPGSPETKAAIEKFLPKELQEAAASQLIDKLAKTGADPTKIAMHMLYGHEPTKAEMAKPEYQTLKNSFERLNSIAGVHTEHPHEDISWKDNGAGKMDCAPIHGRITDHFGHRDHHPVTGHHAMHSGVDIVLNNDKIPALMNGRVEQAGYAGNAGYKITINHGRDHLGRELKTVYMHMKPNLQVHAGDVVSRGELIGYQGATGRVTGKHLHLGLYMNGKAVDPTKHLNIGA